VNWEYGSEENPRDPAGATFGMARNDTDASHFGWTDTIMSIRIQMIYELGARAPLDWMFRLALFSFFIRVLVMMLCSLFVCLILIYHLTAERVINQV
jgi:hypothetical protein